MQSDKINTKEGHAATEVDIANGGPIHYAHAEDWGGCDGYKRGLYTRSLYEVTCPVCLVGKIKSTDDYFDTELYPPMYKFLKAIGAGPEFSLSSELVRLTRVALKHQNDWWDDVCEHNPWVKRKEGN